MTPILKHIWRHPIKSHGREELTSIELSKDKTLPWDRCWAVAHETSKANNGSWAECVNFSRGSKAPKLMAINASLNESNEEVTLSHPELESITIHPEKNADELINWVYPIMPENRSKSEKVIRVLGRGMTDTDYPSISLNSITSHQAVENKLGEKLDIRRWRGNLWLDGLDPWEEFNWVGKTISIGECKIAIQERIVRCLATTANPVTGQRDVDTLSILETWGHKDFGVYGQVLEPGKIMVGDTISIL